MTSQFRFFHLVVVSNYSQQYNIDVCLKCFSFQKGFDTSAFQFLDVEDDDKNNSNSNDSSSRRTKCSVHWFETDFAAVVGEKRTIIQKEALLSTLMSKLRFTFDGVTVGTPSTSTSSSASSSSSPLSSSSSYNLFGSDLRNLDALAEKLTAVGFNRALPTLVICELTLRVSVVFVKLDLSNLISLFRLFYQVCVDVFDCRDVGSIVGVARAATTAHCNRHVRPVHSGRRVRHGDVRQHAATQLADLSASVSDRRQSARTVRQARLRLCRCGRSVRVLAATLRRRATRRSSAARNV
jgi:hypothetical protein